MDKKSRILYPDPAKHLQGPTVGVGVSAGVFVEVAVGIFVFRGVSVEVAVGVLVFTGVFV